MIKMLNEKTIKFKYCTVNTDFNFIKNKCN